MKLIINGKEMSLPSDVQTVADVIDHFQFSSPIIIVEHNEQVLKKQHHATREIQDGDVLEFVQFVGGG